jgi:hypothetical protein
MDGRFLTAFVVPQRWKIGCYGLRPYSLRHMMYLTALESPFASKDPKPEDFNTENVMAFLRVCQSDHPEDAFGSLSIRELWFRTRLQADLLYFTDTIKRCFNYIAECSQSPVTISKDKTETIKQKENVPFPLMMVVMMTSKLGMDTEQAWNTPVGQAIWLLTAFAIQEGSDTQIVSTKDDAKAKSEREMLIKVQAEALAKIKEEARKARQ